MELIFNNKTYSFSEYVNPKEEGLYTAVLTSSENIRCEIVWFNGQLREINELFDQQIKKEMTQAYEPCIIKVPSLRLFFYLYFI